MPMDNILKPHFINDPEDQIVSCQLALIKYWQQRPIFILMNIRRLKKITTPIKNQQQLAKDKLFEISYYSEQRYVDQSHILSTQQKQPEISNVVIKRSQELEQVIRKKTIDNFAYLKRQKDELNISRLQGIHIEAKMPKAQNYIYNTISSNSVFVGSNTKNKQIQSADNEILCLDIRKKVKTMPSPEHQTIIDFKKHIKTQQNKVSPHNNSFLPYGYKKFSKTCYSMKKSYQSNMNKLKQKIKNDLFMKTTFDFKSK